MEVTNTLNLSKKQEKSKTKSFNTNSWKKVESGPLKVVLSNSGVNFTKDLKSNVQDGKFSQGDTTKNYEFPQSDGLAEKSAPQNDNYLFAEENS